LRLTARSSVAAEITSSETGSTPASHPTHPGTRRKSSLSSGCCPAVAKRGRNQRFPAAGMLRGASP
jgi:hypothetical protein